MADRVLTYITLTLLATARLSMAEQPALPDISQGWSIQTGDDMSWSEPSLDDSAWEAIRIGTPWEGHVSDYDGYAWYRLRVRLAGTLQEHPDFQRHQSLKITLGRIDDVDSTWFNGRRIGATGDFPDAYSPAWQVPRTYLIPSSLIRWDDTNVIAIRVYDGGGEGGMVEGPYRLEIASWDDFFAIQIDMGRGDGILADEDARPISATLQNHASVLATGAVHWTMKDDEGTTLATDTVPANIPADGKLRVTSRLVPTGPGFYRVSCDFHSEEPAFAKAESRCVGYRPDQITAALTRPADFDEFWQETLKTLAEVPPQFTMTRVPEMDTKTHTVHVVEMRSLGGARVRGWYEQPKTPGPHAALLRLPGYGETMRSTGIADQMAVFSFNVRGHGNSQQDISGEPVNYWIRGLDDKRGYFYQGAYADCVRAVDFLASRLEIDVHRMAVTGGSQGGGLSLATAALDHRLTLCAPDIPFLCNWAKYFQTTQWPEMDAWIEAEPHRSWETTLRTMSYFDTLNFADHIRCPVFFSLGLQDAICPPATIFAVYNRLRVPKEFHLYPDAGHWVNAAHNARRRHWLRTHLAK